MERDAYCQLVDWKRSGRRKPLLLRGARQVGKTWLLKRFGEREYDDLVYLNFEENPALAGLFEGALSPSAILRNLGLYLGRTIAPGAKTLLVFDEVQVSARALTSLKYFREEAPDVHIAAAGSLLGIRIGRESSFPVGQVDFVELHPMTFFEFLDAHGQSGLRRMLEGLERMEPIAQALHDKLLGMLRRYYLVGGMPEAVACDAGGGDPDEVRRIQQAVLRGYHFDFAKYAAPRDIPKLSLVWESIPTHLAKDNKKFVYSTISAGARAREYENAIAWLVDAGLVHKVRRVETARVPLAAVAAPNAFKLYGLDVGLLCAMTRLPGSALVDGNRLFTEFRGALVESYVAQQLAATIQGGLHYWTSPGGGQAEVDFVVEHDGEVLPLEVKAGVNPRSKSLRSYDDRYSPPRLSRSSLLNLRRDGRIDNYPLYAVTRFPRLGAAAPT